MQLSDVDFLLSTSVVFIHFFLFLGLINLKMRVNRKSVKNYDGSFYQIDYTTRRQNNYDNNLRCPYVVRGGSIGHSRYGVN